MNTTAGDGRFEIIAKAKMEIVQFNKCRSCAYLEPAHHYCDKYLRGAETAVYLCPLYRANEVADLIDAQPTIDARIDEELEK